LYGDPYVVADSHFDTLIPVMGYAGQRYRRNFDKILIVSLVSQSLSPS
jgi:hypothetical protein